MNNIFAVISATLITIAFFSTLYVFVYRIHRETAISLVYGIVTITAVRYVWSIFDDSMDFLDPLGFDLPTIISMLASQLVIFIRFGRRQNRSK